jgi:hypothetical protein
VLTRFLRRRESGAQTVPLSVPSIDVPKYYPQPLSSVAVRKPSSQSKRRRRKPVPVERLYLEPEPEPKRHARALLQLIREECPEKIGKFIPHTHLDRTYRELCQHEGWEPRNWVAIARPLSALTCKRLLKRNGTRFVAYRIPALGGCTPSEGH